MNKTRLRSFCIIFFILTTHLYSQWRDRWQQPDRIMDSVRVEPGMIIGEVGAGEGYFTFKLAQRVGPGGKVYANDVLRRVLNTIERKCGEQGVENVETVLGKYRDPDFPVDTLDMIIMVYAFHEIGEPVLFLNNAMDYLKPGGKVVIVDRDPDKYGGDRDHFLTKRQVVDLVEKSDFQVERILTFLSRDNVYVCARSP